METGVYKIEFFDGSKWNIYFANSTQHKKIIQNLNTNKDFIKSFEYIVKGIHAVNQLDLIFDEIKNRKSN